MLLLHFKSVENRNSVASRDQKINLLVKIPVARTKAHMLIK